MTPCVWYLGPCEMSKHQLHVLTSMPCMMASALSVEDHGTALHVAILDRTISLGYSTS